jgi:hypothetical protein
MIFKLKLDLNNSDECAESGKGGSMQIIFNTSKQ